MARESYIDDCSGCWNHSALRGDGTLPNTESAELWILGGGTDILFDGNNV